MKNQFERKHLVEVEFIGMIVFFLEYFECQVWYRNKPNKANSLLVLRTKKFKCFINTMDTR